MAFELSICTDKQYWNQFVSSSPQGNIFCSTQLLDALDTNYELYFVKKGNQEILGAVILKEKTGEIITAPYSFCMYQGILFEEKVDAEPFHNKIPKLLKGVDFLLAELKKKINKISFCFSIKTFP